MAPGSAVVVFLLLLAVLQHAAFLGLSTDTIGPSTPLRWPNMLLSRSGKFALGFFSTHQLTGAAATTAAAISASDDRYYLGIWYHELSLLTPVWVANRDAPILNTATAVVSISPDGNLILTDHRQSQLWSTSIILAAAAADNFTGATILDTGNLVLGYPATNDTTAEAVAASALWQSFNDPTDTWLPGAKLGRNEVTGVSGRLTAWSSTVDPSTGRFSLSMDNSSQFVLQWNRSYTYWSSGHWDAKTHTLSGIPEQASANGKGFHLQFFNNTNETYMTYALKPDGMVARIALDSTGKFCVMVWLDNLRQWELFHSEPNDQCEVYALCGAFASCDGTGLPFCSCPKGFRPADPRRWVARDYGAGCERKTPLQCARGGTDKFYVMNNVRLPDNGERFEVDSGTHGCEASCLSKCSCTAYSFDSASGNCTMWFGDLINFQEQYNNIGSKGSSLQLRLAASELSEPTSYNRQLTIGLSIAVGSLFCGIFVTIAICWRLDHKNMILKTKHLEDSATLAVLRYRDLKHITRNFSELIGRGAFGSVFKGFLSGTTATIVAVKRLNGLQQQEDKQFRAEVSTIGMIQHINLVRLLGFCSEGRRKFLVYEFMHNGSLERHLFQAYPTNLFLNWKIRYQIALGTAKALEYLHEKCHDCIIHCDIKPENILLDESFNPKIADFGLAKLLGRDFSQVLTSMRGTPGYLAPEWITGVPITPKVDVFSYGMLLFEITLGRRNTEQTITGEGVLFHPKLVAGKLTNGDVLSLVDKRLVKGDDDAVEIERACRVACWCIQEDESHRPTMGQVIQMLEGIVAVDVPPTPRSLMLLGASAGSVNYFFEGTSEMESKTSVSNWPAAPSRHLV